MAVDTLAFASRGVYDAAGTTQATINVRFASWGLIGVGGSAPAASALLSRELPHHPIFPRVPTHGRGRWRGFMCLLFHMALAAPIGRTQWEF